MHIKLPEELSACARGQMSPAAVREEDFATVVTQLEAGRAVSDDQRRELTAAANLVLSLDNSPQPHSAIYYCLGLMAEQKKDLPTALDHYRKSRACNESPKVAQRIANVIRAHTEYKTLHKQDLADLAASGDTPEAMAVNLVQAVQLMGKRYLARSPDKKDGVEAEKFAMFDGAKKSLGEVIAELARAKTALMNKNKGIIFNRKGEGSLTRSIDALLESVKAVQETELKQKEALLSLLDPMRIAVGERIAKGEYGMHTNVAHCCHAAAKADLATPLAGLEKLHRDLTKAISEQHHNKNASVVPATAAGTKQIDLVGLGLHVGGPVRVSILAITAATAATASTTAAAAPASAVHGPSNSEHAV
jgi:hypothetical protein